MTPEKFDSMPKVKLLYLKNDFLKASLMAKSIGNLTKSNEMRAHSQKLLNLHRKKK